MIVEMEPVRPTRKMMYFQIHTSPMQASADFYYFSCTITHGFFIRKSQKNY
uniref:Uncharacterized protein n=1 Tax=Solanum lycopersicum TaxID=4081 RepID=A0A3Q7GD44_SOLLC